MNKILSIIKITSILIIMIMASCKTTKYSFDPEKTNKAFITFGNGGGITGAIKKYYFTNDGDIYFQEADSIKFIAHNTGKNKCPNIWKLPEARSR
jgi:hypothetical protein